MHKILDLQKKYSQKIDLIDLEILLSFVLNKNREFVLSHPEHQLSFWQSLKLNYLIKKRLKNKPAAYLIGKKEFYGIDFLVDKNTLIPRPETELIVDEALCILKDTQINSVIDIGTGSGNIPIAILKNFPAKNNIKFFAVDISSKALNIAQKNAQKIIPDQKINFLKGDLLNPVIENKIIEDNQTVLITANLPYLSAEIYNNCPAKNYEPKTALLSGQAGLAHYEKLFKEIKNNFSDKNIKFFILLEISPEQKEKIHSLIQKYFPNSKIEFQKDLAEKWRMVKIVF